MVGNLFFRDIWVEVHRIWQGFPEENVIMVKLGIEAYARVPWKAEAQVIL